MGAGGNAAPNRLPILVRRAFHDCNAAPTGPVFLSLPMDVMEEMSTVGIAEPSTIDRNSVAGSLEQLAAHLVAVEPGRLIIIAGDEVYGQRRRSRGLCSWRRRWAAPVFGSSWPARFRSRPRIRSGRATCRPKRPKSHAGWKRSTHLRARRQVADHHSLHGGLGCPRRVRRLPDVGGRARPRPDIPDQAVGGGRHQGIAQCTDSTACEEASGPRGRLRRVAERAAGEQKRAAAAARGGGRSGDGRARHHAAGRGAAGHARHRSRHRNCRRGDRHVQFMCELSSTAPRRGNTRSSAAAVLAGACRRRSGSRWGWPRACRVPGRRRRRPVLAAGAMDRSARGAAGDVRGDEQP